MELTNTPQKFIESLAGYFHKEHKKVRENIALCVYGMVRNEAINTAQIARSMNEVNGLSFKTNDMRVYRLLQSDNFQVSDRLWRGHANLVFQLLRESGLEEGSLIQVNVDFTSDRDDFLILCASINFQSQSIPIYFSMRNYPKKKGAIDQKKMELAFFKALKHLLPKTHRYCIVADRGFGNKRIIEILENLEFEHTIRMTDNFSLIYKDKTIIADELPHKNIRRTSYFLPNWERHVDLVKVIKDDAHWVLAVSQGADNVHARYEQRFSIEKMFKNIKSGGFNLEKLLIEKYDRFKRMLFIACVAYAILVATGLFIRNHAHTIKKNFSLTLNVLTAFSH